MTNQDDASANAPRDKYVRRLPAQLEIDRLPGAEDTDFVTLLVTADEPETLVYGIRRLHEMGLEQSCQPLWGRLIVLLQKPLARQAARWPFELRDDVIQLATMEIWERILDRSEKERFAEFNLFSVIPRVISNAARTLQRQRGEWEKTEAEWPASIDVMLEGGLLESSLAISGLSVEDSVLDSHAVEELLSRLPDKVARAVILRQAGFRIESKDPAKPGISDVLQVSPRTVQNYLREACRLLATYQPAQLDS